MVEYKEGKSTDETLAKAIEKKGYKAKKISKGEYEKIVKQAQEKHEQHREREQK